MNRRFPIPGRPAAAPTLAAAAALMLIPAALHAQQGAPAAMEVAPRNVQIAAALLAGPEERREDATVLGYDADGKLVTLRKGTNDLICLADDPTDDRFSTACYHESLEPYMERGRELREAGVTGMERMTKRWEETDLGKLPMPDVPATLYVLTGDGFDPATGEVANSHLRWVVYIPYATPESTGLSTTPGEGQPWLMFPGTAGAHIMITPPRDGAGS